MKDPASLQNFFSRLKKSSESFGHLPFNRELKLQPTSQIPWFYYAVPWFPLSDILREVQNLKPLFVEHREGESHHGWKSLCLHGISAQKTMCYFDYGLKEDDSIYHWTEIAPQCPITYNFFKNQFPADTYKRIRFMLLEPGGFVAPHRDRNTKSLGPLSIALNTPDQCYFGVEGHGLIPLRAGGFYLIDLSNNHSVWNRSQEDRYHITVEAHHGSHFYQYMYALLKTYEKKYPFRRFINSDYYSTRKKILRGLNQSQPVIK